MRTAVPAVIGVCHGVAHGEFDTVADDVLDAEREHDPLSELVRVSLVYRVAEREHDALGERD